MSLPIIVISGLHGQLLINIRVVGKGQPQVCKHLTNKLLSLISSKTFTPILVIMRMLQTNNFNFRKIIVKWTKLKQKCNYLRMENRSARRPLY